MNFLLAILSVCLIVHRAGAVYPLRFRHRSSGGGDDDGRNCPFVRQVDSWARSESTNDKGIAKAVAGARKPILTKVDNGASYIMGENGQYIANPKSDPKPEFQILSTSSQTLLVHGEKKRPGAHRKPLQMLGVRDDGIAYAKTSGTGFLIPWDQFKGPAEALELRCALYNKGESIQDLGQKMVYAVVKVPTIPERHHGEFTFEIPYYEMELSQNEDCGPDVMISQKIEASSLRCKFMANLQCRSGTPTSAESVNNCDVKWCNETQVAIWPCACGDTTCMLKGVPGSRPPTPVSPSSLTPTSSGDYVTADEDFGSPPAAQNPPPSPS